MSVGYISGMSEEDRPSFREKRWKLRMQRWNQQNSTVSHWTFGLSAAGFDPATVRLRRKWSSERVIDEIQRLAMTKERFRHMTSSPDKISLVSASERYFGCWTAALAAAGIQSKTSHCRPWTRSLIIRTIRKQEEEGAPFAHLPLSLDRAAERLFGSWPAALKAALGDRAAAVLHLARPCGKAKLTSRCPIETHG